MYEDYVQIGDVQTLFPNQTLSEICKADLFEIAWPGIYWHCSIIELDVPATFYSSGQLFGGNGREIDLPELFDVGKQSFASLSKVYTKKIEKNIELEVLCYIFAGAVLKMLREICQEGRGTNKSGGIVSTEDLPHISLYETMPRLIKRVWSESEHGVRGFFEAYLHCQIIRSIDSAVIQQLMGDPKAMAEAMEELYAYKGCLDWISSVSEIRRSHASMAAKARHAETDWIKQQVLDYYEEHKHEFKSLRSAAKAIERREPVAFRTIYDWLRSR